MVRKKATTKRATFNEATAHKSTLEPTAPTSAPGKVDNADSTASTPRVLRKRKQTSYVDLNEESDDEDDELEPMSKRKVKVAAISKATSETRKISGPANRSTAEEVKGKKAVKATVVVIDESDEGDEKEMEQTPPAPKAKVGAKAKPTPKPKPTPLPKKDIVPKKKSKAPDDVLEYDKNGNEKRKRDYAEEPSQKFLNNMARALNEPLCFVDRERCDMDEAPQETFTIAGSALTDYTVSICHVPTCTCADFTFRRTPCKHLIYTMVKVLKVASTSPLLHQYALTSTELQSIFDNAPAAACIGLSASADEEEEEHSNRKSIEGDCPICFMDFGESKQTTTWCREFCGNNVHEGCMRTWLSVQKRQYGKGTCPYCRGDWAEA